MQRDNKMTMDQINEDAEVEIKEIEKLDEKYVEQNDRESARA